MPLTDLILSWDILLILRFMMNMILIKVMIECEFFFLVVTFFFLSAKPREGELLILALFC